MGPAPSPGRSGPCARETQLRLEKADDIAGAGVSIPHRERHRLIALEHSKSCARHRVDDWRSDDLAPSFQVLVVPGRDGEVPLGHRIFPILARALPVEGTSAGHARRWHAAGNAPDGQHGLGQGW